MNLLKPSLNTSMMQTPVSNFMPFEWVLNEISALMIMMLPSLTKQPCCTS